MNKINDIMILKISKPFSAHIVVSILIEDPVTYLAIHYEIFNRFG
jgi:hypothetical protein